MLNMNCPNYQQNADTLYLILVNLNCLLFYLNKENKKVFFRDGIAITNK